MRRLYVLAFAMLGCAAPGAPEHSVRVTFGPLDEPLALQTGIQYVRSVVYDASGEVVSERTASRSGIEMMDSDMDGRSEAVHDQLPIDAPISIALFGYPTLGGDPSFSGGLTNVVLRRGERRYMNVRLFDRVGRTVLTDGVPAARFLHTMTPLADGRVLIAGGFSQVAATACAGTAPPGSRCYTLTASRDAALFDPASGTFVEARGGDMLQARGGHTATILADGRVLIAGGASTATLILRAGATGRYDIEFEHGPGDASSIGFELFEPDALAEVEDIGADGDLERGAFVGSAVDPMVPGRLDTARFLHAAVGFEDLVGEAAVDGVMLAGGLENPQSYTVFGSRRPGGYGVGPTLPLLGRHPMPSAALVVDGAPLVFVAGGGSGAGPTSVLELCVPDLRFDGRATSCVALPMENLRPDWDLVRPSVEVLRAETANGAHSILQVAGWYGPRCAASGVAYGATDRCVDGSRSYGFRTSAGSRLGAPSSLVRPHAFGASARMTDGAVVFSGGFADSSLRMTAEDEFFEGYAVGTTLSPIPARQFSNLMTTRAMHAIAALPFGAYLVLGGIRVEAGVPSLVSTAEVVFARAVRP